MIHKLEFPLFVINQLTFACKTSSFKGIFLLNSTKQKFLIPCLSLFIFKMCFSFAEFEKTLSFEVTLGAIGAKTRFFKMWPKSMHDQKFVF